MENSVKEAENDDIREIVDQNTRIIEALKNLNQKICKESKSVMPLPEGQPEEPQEIKPLPGK